MLPKQPKRTTAALIGKVFKGFFYAEIVLFGLSYYYWNKLNHNQDYRHELFLKRQWILELYYQTGELMGEDCIRRRDYKKWGVKKSDLAEQAASSNA